MSNHSWINLESLQGLEEAHKNSFEKPVVLFKHSISCSVSSAAKRHLSHFFDPDALGANLYYLDLINYRDVSNEIAEKYGVQHESPQVLVIKDGSLIYHASHGAIDADIIKNAFQ